VSKTNQNETDSQGSKKQLQKEKTQIIQDTQSRVYTIVTDWGFGSGFLLERKGTVVTNAHVVAGYTDVVVRDADGNESEGVVIGISSQFDVALIQVDDYAETNPLPTEDEQTALGSEIIALGKVHRDLKILLLSVI
jgi:S1-C subfamily serine protease